MRTIDTFNGGPGGTPTPMAAETRLKGSEAESREIAEHARQTSWEGRGFLRELFLGDLQLDLIHPFPVPERRPEFAMFLRDFERFLREQVDPVAIDRTGEYPETVLAGLRKLGAFGMKIPKEYGGLGFTVTEYCEAMQLSASYDGNVTAMLSAHQSIGVPQPLKLFGTAEQKARYLPRCAAGAISGFSLTEPHVGSDPARLATTVERQGDHYVLNGQKLWCTNSTLAELLVVMARDPKTQKISMFVVEMAWEGVRVEYRCRFMGLKALPNGLVSFTNVRVPVENLIGEEGRGLRMALTTLNTGRLTLPAVCTGAVKQCLRVCREWSNTRVQWGVPIGRHEVIAHEIADMSATAFALDSVWKLTAAMADHGGYDIRLEAAAAKEWNTTRAWQLIDRALQIRGGRGFETESSAAGRGEAAIGIERMLRDNRINMIFEGTSQIMHLLMAREAVDKHLQTAGALIDPKRTVGQKLAALPAMARFYSGWYPRLWWPLPGRTFAEFQELAPHLRFVERSARKLARETFHAMVRYGAKMERKQAFLFRTVDVVMELFAMAASLSHARALAEWGSPQAEQARELADLFCRGARRRVRQLFADLWRNDDECKNRLSVEVLAGRYDWLEEGVLDLGLRAEDYATRSFTPPPPVI